MLRRILALVSTLLVTALVACDDDLVEDATFRMWCAEDRLCAWDVETGHIRRAPTWHKNDPGVELVDTPTAISQVVDKAPRCLEFTTIADVEPSAQVTIALDFDDDGSIDYEQPVASVGFHDVKTLVTAPANYTGFKITIAKKGQGRAVLAQIRVQTGSDCGADPLRRHDQPLGTPCTAGEPSECKSGVCCEGVCAECCTDPKYIDVGPDGGRVDSPIAACPGDQTCERRDVWEVTLFFAVAPQQCDPGKRARPAGAVCLANDDCASGLCEGASSESQLLALQPDAAPIPCDPSFFPDAGEGCYFTSVREGTCR